LRESGNKITALKIVAVKERPSSRRKKASLTTAAFVSPSGSDTVNAKADDTVRAGRLEVCHGASS